MKEINKILLITTLLLCSWGNYASAQDSLQLNRLKAEYEVANDSTKLRLLLNILATTELDNVDTALYLAHKALTLSEQLEDSFSMSRAMNSIGIYLNIQNKHQEALRYDLEALRLIKKFDDPLNESNMLNNIGEDYFYLDLYNEAFDYYRQSLDKAYEAEDSLSIAVATYNMGRVLKAMGQYDRAREYIEESMAISEQIADTAGIAYSKYDLAQIHNEEGNYELALEELKKAYEISVSVREDVLTPQILAELAATYMHSTDYRNALINYDRALEIYQQQNSQSGIGQVYYGKGNVTLKMGDDAGARIYYEMCRKIADDINDNELIIKCYSALATLYEKDKNFEQALDYYRKYKELEDSIFSEQKKEQFAQIQIKYETAKKDIEIELLNQKEAQQQAKIRNEEFIRNILVVILAFTGVLLFSLYKNNEKRRKINELLVEQQKEIQSKSRELASLVEMKDKFFSIVSHDLRSPINALVGILDILDADNITQEELREVSRSLKIRLDNTRKLLDTLLDWAMLQMNEIKINAEAINLYDLVGDNLAFFSDLEDKKISFVNNTKPDDIVMADRNMLDLIIRNLVSNSIKFTTEGGKIEVTTERGPKKSLIVMIKDSGIGMSEEQMAKIFDTNTLYTTRGTANEKGTGLGLRLCKEFVERMGGNIWVESVQGEGSTFKFTINRA